MVIDLSPMKGVRFDPFLSTIRAEPGCTQGDVNHLGQSFGFVVPAGVVSTTGIAGLTLGGGTGYLTRKYGLTIDNLLEVDMVLADGRFVTANADDHPDLFWAVRGGGGNFGIVTSFLYRACPVGDVVGGPMFWDLNDAREVLEWHAEFMPTASEDLYGFFAFLRAQPGDPFPATPAPQESLWHHLVLFRPSRGCRCCFQTHPRISRTATGSDRSDALYGHAKSV
jgi:FAD/FMN-containing dehydrogenase